MLTGARATEASPGGGSLRGLLGSLGASVLVKLHLENSEFAQPTWAQPEPFAANCVDSNQAAILQ